MPKGPKGQKRPADVIGAAIRVAKIATGEEDEDEDSVSQLSGRAGGMIRAANLSADRRKEIAKQAAAKRWSKTS